MTDEQRCYVCNRAESDDPDEVELRPYGAGGRPICFDCMTGDPAREQEAYRQFDAACDAAGPVVVIGEGAPRAATYEEAKIVSDVLPGLPKPSRA